MFFTFMIAPPSPKSSNASLDRRAVLLAGRRAALAAPRGPPGARAFVVPLVRLANEPAHVRLGELEELVLEERQEREAEAHADRPRRERAEDPAAEHEPEPRRGEDGPHRVALDPALDV